jgi:hypothetical protein
MATESMFRDAHEIMTCSCCQEPAILTVEEGLCPRCFYKQECEAICSAAGDEVDRVLAEAPSGLSVEEPPPPPGIYVPASPEPVWSW